MDYIGIIFLDFPYQCFACMLTAKAGTIENPRLNSMDADIQLVSDFHSIFPVFFRHGAPTVCNQAFMAVGFQTFGKIGAYSTGASRPTNGINHKNFHSYRTNKFLTS